MGFRISGLYVSEFKDKFIICNCIMQNRLQIRFIQNGTEIRESSKSL